MNPENNHIEDLFRSGFDSFEDMPDDAVWENVAQAVVKRKRRKRLVFLIFNTVLLLCVLWYSTFRTITPGGSSQAADNRSQNTITCSRTPADTTRYAVAVKPLEQNFIAVRRTLHRPSEPQKMTVSSSNPVLQPVQAYTLPDYTSEVYRATPELHLMPDDIKKFKRKLPRLSLQTNAGAAVLSVPAYHSGAYKVAVSDIAVSLSCNTGKHIRISAGAGFQKLQMQAYSRADVPHAYVSDSVLAISRRRSVFYYKYYDTTIHTSRTAISHDYVMMQIPLSVDYIINPEAKLTLALGTSVIYTRLLSGKIYDAKPLPLGSKTEAISFTETNTFTRNNSLQAAFRLSFGYRTGARTLLSIMPEYRYSISSMTQTETGKQGHMQGCGIRTGITYLF